MATGDPLILGKDNVANNRATFLTRKDTVRTSGRVVFWVMGSEPDANAIRADATRSGQGVLGVNPDHGVGVEGVSKSGIAVMGDSLFEGPILLGIGVGGYAKTGDTVQVNIDNRRVILMVPDNHRGKITEPPKAEAIDVESEVIE